MAGGEIDQQSERGEHRRLRVGQLRMPGVEVRGPGRQLPGGQALRYDALERVELATEVDDGDELAGPRTPQDKPAIVEKAARPEEQHGHGRSGGPREATCA